jgi:hypothetical protein
LLTPSLELLADLQQSPQKARLETSLAGVHLDQEVWLVINGQELGPLAVDRFVGLLGWSSVVVVLAAILWNWSAAA